MLSRRGLRGGRGRLSANPEETELSSETRAHGACRDSEALMAVETVENKPLVTVLSVRLLTRINGMPTDYLILLR